MVSDVGDALPTDGSTEWTAVPWKLPREISMKLACLLFCKGVSRNEVGNQLQTLPAS